MGFPGDSDGKESACKAGDFGSIPGSRWSLKKGMATHYSILAWRIPWRGALWATVYRDSKNQKQLSNFQFHFMIKDTDE